MASHFETKRLNGKSDAQVVLEFVHGGTPGTIYSYAALRDQLERGTSTTFTNARIGGVVRRANRKLLTNEQRCLQVVPTVGYRMALATDHMPMAVTRQNKADRQLKDSLHILSNVKWEEMDPISREVHRAHLNVTSSLIHVTRGILRQNAKRDDAINDMLQRLSSLEDTVHNR